MITKEQIKAARAMLDWSQSTLAEKTDGEVSSPTIKLIESGKSKSTEKTLFIIQQVFEDAGIEFLPNNGLRKADDILTIYESEYENDNAYAKLMDDVYYTLKKRKSEALFSFVDQSLSPHVISEKQKLLDEAGISMRFLVRNGDTNFMFDKTQYRYLPKGLYLNNPSIVYDNKYALTTIDPSNSNLQKIFVFNNADIAQIRKLEFDIIWNNAELPK